MNKQNIILIGMPGAGKSSVGVILAKVLGYEFIDTDLVIQHREKRLLREIIADEGNEGFLAIENEVNATLEADKSVIAPGGSAIYGKEELIDVSEEESREFLESLGVKDSGVSDLIRAVYHLLGLRTYLTTGIKETRAWTIPAGAKAPQAAGVIHTDFERGFIAAEVVHYDDLVSCGGKAGAREHGKLRIEGKEYVVKDGDVIEFRFNV